ncbi:MAG: lytic transglycosylase domain-containing protein [Synergistaceae bacterium]|nr:lytic transglycosylase domain-containing protein [Synergistaceae bacterium]
MATIVQPYNPWREQLALTALGNVAGNILGDLWQTHKQNEQNRKANAFRGALSDNLKNIAQQANITLAQPEAPQGYNSNPWANAFHQKYAPLTQFDIGTSQRMPTLQDIAQNADNLAASKRFSMLSPEMVQSVKNDFINQAETKRLQDLQNSYIDSFRNADNPAEMLRQLAMGVGVGALSDKALSPFAQWVIHQTPQYHQVDAGDRIIGSVFHPYEGTDTPTAQYNVGVSPNTAATVQGNLDAANIHANATRDVANINAQSDYARAQATIRAQQIAALQDRAKALREEIANDRESLRDMNEKDRAIMQNVIAGKKLELKEINRELLQGYSGMGTQTQGAANSQPVKTPRTGKIKYDDVKSIVDNAAQANSIDSELLQAMIKHESAWTVDAVSNKNAQGLMQIIPSTQKLLGITDPFDVVQNINGGAKYIGDLIKEFGSVEKALAAYNWGPANVKAGKKFPGKVQEYVNNIMRDYNALKAQRQIPQTTQSVSQPSPQTQPQTPQQTQDREVMRDKDGTIIYQSNLDEMIREGAKQGLGPAGVKARLRQKGFVDVPEKREVTSVPPVLNWSPSYMGGIPQGQALTSAPLSYVPPVIANSSATQPSATPADFVHSEHSPQQPFMQPPLASMPAQSSSDNFNSWRSPFGSFDIHQPILRGGISNQPLPTQTVSDDNRNQPLFTGNAANMIRNAVAGLNLTQGKSDAIPMWGIDYRNYAFDPRYPNAERASWPIGAGYDTQQILGWINSHQNYEIPFWGHSQPTQSPQKLPLRGNPVTTGANPWSYVNEQNVFPFWNFIDWIDNGSVGGYDISPQVSISAPSQRVDYNNAARNVLWNLFFNRR